MTITRSIQSALFEIATTWDKVSEQREILRLSQDNVEVEYLLGCYSPESLAREVRYQIVKESSGSIPHYPTPEETEYNSEN
jgi:hypothetical protein